MLAAVLLLGHTSLGFFSKWDGHTPGYGEYSGGAAVSFPRNVSQCVITGCDCQLQIGRRSAANPWSAAGCGNAVDSATWGAANNSSIGSGGRDGALSLFFAGAAPPSNYTLLLVEHADVFAEWSPDGFVAWPPQYKRGQAKRGGDMRHTRVVSNEATALGQALGQAV